MLTQKLPLQNCCETCKFMKFFFVSHGKYDKRILKCKGLSMIFLETFVSI